MLSGFSRGLGLGACCAPRRQPGRRTATLPHRRPRCDKYVFRCTFEAVSAPKTPDVGPGGFPGLLGTRGSHDITEDDLKAYIAKRQDEADRAKFEIEREDILGRSPRLRLAALLRFSSCLSKPRLEALVDDVECLERTWYKSMPDSSDLIAEVQAQLRSALAALPESDPPDHNCPSRPRSI